MAVAMGMIAVAASVFPCVAAAAVVIATAATWSSMAVAMGMIAVTASATWGVLVAVLVAVFVIHAAMG